MGEVDDDPERLALLDALHPARDALETPSSPSRTAAGSRPSGLAEGDDGERVVDVEPAGEPEVELAAARGAVVGDRAGRAASSLDAGGADVGRGLGAVGEDPRPGLVGHPDERARPTGRRR